jgi:hypothetical protein
MVKCKIIIKIITTIKEIVIILVECNNKTTLKIHSNINSVNKDSIKIIKIDRHKTNIITKLYKDNKIIWYLKSK